MLGANETIATPRVPPTTPMTIHGRRMPSRDVGAVAHPPEERIAEHRHEGTDPGDKRQAAGCLFDAHQRS